MNIGMGNGRQTILLIDGDAHARKPLRIALEAANYTVGEACNTQEGERTALRIKPDAILADLMTDSANHGATLPERLHDAGLDIPIYIVSAGSDAVLDAVGLHELGVVGSFVKPIDAPAIIDTLRTRLGSDLDQAPHA